MFKEEDTDFLGSERQRHWKTGEALNRSHYATGKYCLRNFLLPLVLVPGLMSVKCTGTERWLLKKLKSKINGSPDSA